MQTRLDHDVLCRVSYLTGSVELAKKLPSIPSLEPFNNSMIEFLNNVSRCLMRKKETRLYSDVVTFGFWIRRASLQKLKERFIPDNDTYKLGKGVAFHIAPSNVPVNFAYSLVAGLITGNANLVRVPSRDFPQVKIIVDAFNETLKQHEEMKPFIILVRYERDKDINDIFSSIADVRIVWGGDNTIAELRKSPLPPRSGEVTFADRYSLAVIDSDSYLKIEDKDKVAQDFYNDTFLSDQNACTSPRILIWTGSRIDEAKNEFWKREHELVEKKYDFQSIQGVNKLASSYLIAVAEANTKIEPHEDNLIVRVKVTKVSDSLMDYKDNSGYFFEYDCQSIMEIKDLCDNKRCQTIAYIGSKEAILPLVKSGVKGIDRIVPMGKTMDFDLIWDGYDLSSSLTKVITII